MGAHPFTSTRAAIESADARSLEYNPLAFKFAGRCQMSERCGAKSWTRGGVRLRGNLRWWHLCRECWSSLMPLEDRR